MNTMNQLNRVSDSRISINNFSERPIVKNELSLTAVSTLAAAFDYQIDRDANLLVVASHIGNAIIENSVFAEFQGRLLPKMGDPGRWLNAVRETIHTRKPNILRLDSDHGVIHVTLSPGATDSRFVRVLLERSNPSVSDLFDAYCRNYKLTKSEASVLWLLLDGQEPKRIATTKTVAVSTVRTQIKSILQKTEEPNIRCQLLRVAKLTYGQTQNFEFD